MKRARRKPGTAFNWSEARERLARAGASSAATLELSPERIQAIMEQRTRALARAPAPAPPPGETLEVLTFDLGAERYAVEAKYVREVVRLVDFTPVPGAGDFILGITNLRGEVVCVVDLRRLFSIPHEGLTDLSRIVVFGEDRAELGVLADRAHEISRFHTQDILPAPESLAGIGREHLIGVTRDALVVLDGAALLRDPRLVVDQSETGSA